MKDVVVYFQKSDSLRGDKPSSYVNLTDFYNSNGGLKTDGHMSHGSIAGHVKSVENIGVKKILEQVEASLSSIREAGELFRKLQHNNKSIYNSRLDRFPSDRSVFEQMNSLEDLRAKKLLGQVESSLSNIKDARDLLYHWERNSNGRVASVYAVFFIEKNYAAQNLEAINSLLLSVSVKQLTEWSMVALLRSSFSAKHLLPAWNLFYESVKTQLEENPRRKRLLAGLDD
jgi:hypothetical protein